MTRTLLAERLLQKQKCWGENFWEMMIVLKPKPKIKLKPTPKFEDAPGRGTSTEKNVEASTSGKWWSRSSANPKSNWNPALNPNSRPKRKYDKDPPGRDTSTETKCWGGNFKLKPSPKVEPSAEAQKWCGQFWQRHFYRKNGWDETFWEIRIALKLKPKLK